jgi:enoyl-CoA hydratase/carnithine racemase
MKKVNFETSGPLGILTLTNPPLNLLSGELLDDLGAAVKEVKRVSVRALLLRAEGKIFSDGATSVPSREKMRVQRETVLQPISE